MIGHSKRDVSMMLANPPRPHRDPEKHDLEGDILTEIHDELANLEWRGQRACYIDRRNVGTFRHLYGPGHIKIETKGKADLYGFLCTGRALEVEVKTVVGVVKRHQRTWRETCLEMNVLHIVARAPGVARAAVLAALDEWAEGQKK